MIAVCHGNNLQGEKDENTMGMGRHASRGEMMGSETGRGEERETWQQKQKIVPFVVKENVSEEDEWKAALKLHVKLYILV